jgi:hypothetical protein
MVICTDILSQKPGIELFMSIVLKISWKHLHRSSFSWTSAQIWLGKHKRTYFFMKICRYGLENQDQTYKTWLFLFYPTNCRHHSWFHESWFLFYPTKCGISMNTCRYNLVLLFHYISRLISNYKSNMLGYFLPQTRLI